MDYLYTHFLSLCLVAAFYIVAMAFYRLALIALAQFPKPRLATATGLYEAYFQLLKNGTSTWEINRLHQEYGPIIRIKPNELHIKDPDYYSTLYTGPGKHRNKDPWHSFISFPQSMMSTTGHELHRAHRRVLGQFLKEKAVLKLEPVIKANIKKLERHFSASVSSDKPLELHTAFQCFASDTMPQYCFGEREGFHYLDQPELSASWKTQITWLFELSQLNRHVPILSSIGRLFPWMACNVMPPYRNIYQLEQDVSMKGYSTASTAVYPTILADPDVPASEKESSRLEDDAVLLTIAGTDAATQATAITFFHILNNRKVYEKLRVKLFENIPEVATLPTIHQLEQLPYLSATIKEGLHLSSIITTRLPRIAPDEVLQYGQWSIPAGTPNMNWAWMYLLLGTLLRRYNLALHKTTERNVEMTWDNFIGQTDLGMNNIQVKVLGECQEGSLTRDVR
ncbi:hypothetical protein RU639_005086 [Aspergillus parasiticus]